MVSQNSWAYTTRTLGVRSYLQTVFIVFNFGVQANFRFFSGVITDWHSDHGDDKSLVLPRMVAATQVIVAPIPFKGC